MTNPTTSLEFSRKVFEIIWEQETLYTHERVTHKETGEWSEWNVLMAPFEDATCEHFGIKHEVYPAYTFGELIRVIPIIAEKKGWKWTNQWAKDCAILYMGAPTPEQGMKNVEAHLMPML